MTAADAFEKWWSQRNPGLPWESDKTTAAEAFTAGWVAHESIASVAQLAEHRICNAGVAGSTPAASSKHEGKWVDGPGALLSDTFAQAHAPACYALRSAPPEGSRLAYKGPINAEAVYAAYPRKIGKQAALKAITSAQKKAFITWDALLAKTVSYANAVAQWPESEKQYIPHPATWFNRGSYEDDPNEWVRGAATTSQFRTHH